jgi:hypothetical protein
VKAADRFRLDRLVGLQAEGLQVGLPVVKNRQAWNRQDRLRSLDHRVLVVRIKAQDPA